MTDDFCDKCFTVVKHEGTPKGSFETINGENGRTHQVYASRPSGSYDNTIAVVICTDIFGLALNNNLLIADAFAENGLQCFIPDILNGDPVPEDLKTNPEVAKTFSLPEWRTRHTPPQSRPALDATISHLIKNVGVRQVHAIGYCFGARAVMDLVLEHEKEAGFLKTAAFAHPSQLRIPDDFDAYLNKAQEDKVPLLFLTCERDMQYPQETQKKVDDLLNPLNGEEGARQEVRYKRVYYPDNDHGFAVRGDISQPQIKKAKEDAFKQALDWFKTK